MAPREGRGKEMGDEGVEFQELERGKGMKSKMRSFFLRKKDEGASALEYAILLSGIAVTVLSGAMFLGNTVCALYANADKVMQEQAQAAPSLPSSPGVATPGGDNGGGGGGGPVGSGGGGGAAGPGGYDSGGQ